MYYTLTTILNCDFTHLAVLMKASLVKLARRHTWTLPPDASEKRLNTDSGFKLETIGLKRRR